MTKIAALPPRPARISAKLRRTIDLRIRQGRTITDASAEAGMSPQGFHKAMKRQAVRDRVEDVQRRFVAEVDAQRLIYKARARFCTTRRVGRPAPDRRARSAGFSEQSATAAFPLPSSRGNIAYRSAKPLRPSSGHRSHVQSCFSPFHAPGRPVDSPSS